MSPFIPILLISISSLFGIHPESQPSTGDWQGAWVSSNPLIHRLYIENDANSWVIKVQGEENGETFQWESGQLASAPLASQQRMSEGSESLQVSLFSAQGYLDLSLALHEGYLEATAHLTRIHASGPTEQTHHIVFTQQVGEDAMGNSQSEKVGFAADASGTIAGTVAGPARSAASLFMVSLYGPDEPSLFHSTQSLQEGFQFAQLTTGHYWIHVEPRAETGVQASVSQQAIYLTGDSHSSCQVDLR